MKSTSASDAPGRRHDGAMPNAVPGGRRLSGSIESGGVVVVVVVVVVVEMKVVLINGRKSFNRS